MKTFVPRSKPPCKAVIYTRFSPRRNSDKSESCEAQEALCRRYIENHDYELIGVKHDRAISGSEEDRPLLWQAINELPKRGVLIALKFDRLARDVYLMECIKRLVKKQNARIEVVSGDIEGTGPEQVMVRQVLSAFAEYERKVIAARTKSAMLYHQKVGLRMSRFPPYGYRLDPENNEILLPNGREQEAIVKILELRATGIGSSGIAKQLNRLMPDRCRGKKWHAKTILAVIARAID